MNILFIGNSYTYYNDMPTEIFKVLGESAGLTLNVTAITNGGHTLVLLEAAHVAATEPPAIPEEYQHSSVGQ